MDIYKEILAEGAEECKLQAEKGPKKLRNFFKGKAEAYEDALRWLNEMDMEVVLSDASYKNRVINCPKCSWKKKQQAIFDKIIEEAKAMSKEQWEQELKEVDKDSRFSGLAQDMMEANELECEAFSEPKVKTTKEILEYVDKHISSLSILSRSVTHQAQRDALVELRDFIRGTDGQNDRPN